MAKVKRKHVKWNDGGWYTNRVGNPVLVCGNLRVAIDLDTCSLSDLSTLVSCLRRVAAKRIRQERWKLNQKMNGINYNARLITETMEVE